MSGDRRGDRVPVENTGNAIVRPAGEITLVDPGNDEVVLNAPVAMGSVDPGHETTLEIAIPPSVPEGVYEVSIALADEERGWDGYETSLVLTAPDPDEALAPDRIIFNVVTVEAVPDAANAQYADVSADITNNGEAVENARLSLSVSRDGELVEDYTLVEPLTLPNGSTTVDQRYIPGPGWKSGEYTFELILENVESNGDIAVVVARFPVEGTITIP